MFEDDKIKDLEQKLNTAGRQSFLEKKEGLENAPQKPEAIPEENVIKESAKNDVVLKRLRTYEGDIAETIRKQNESVASINIAEQKRKEVSQVETEDSGPSYYIKNTVITIVSILLIVGGIGAIGIFYYLKSTNTPPPIINPVKTIISADTIVEIDASDLTKQKIIDSVKNAQINGESGSITYVSFSNTSGETKTPIETEKFFTILQTKAPGALVRSFNKEFMLGISSDENRSPFLLIKLDSFDNTFAGMLGWEKTAGEDLRSIFLNEKLIPQITTTEFASSTGTSTATTTLIPIDLEQSWGDLIVQNKDTRILRDLDSNIVLIYSFLDEQTLLITTNEKTFIEILNRFVTSKLTR
ncbi:MAG: hypothetical protein HQ402_01945 [Parcubacteria group bacterium]|nr:hypothetical protein [Parcubacteria group bacterium]